MDKSLVTRATSPDEVPTPGYMFNEIARITQASADASKVTRLGIIELGVGGQ